MKCKQTGATIVEFALVLPLFMTFLLGVLEFSRMLYTWNVANEATREGARYAVVCADPSSKDRIVARMQTLMPQVGATKVNVNWQPAGCDAKSCEGVTVSLTDLNFTWVTPIVGAAIGSTFAMPAFSTYLQREMMSYNDKVC
ncbi:TadE/TadG family type IV pilus assembly protein [Massilia sp. LXY-6]|uniref:TadE/TadG family type IV pilus assembly protein n=1 Tax=Massilia sp. LXY-6 TaxID=3379823 RepID=UPI003EE366B6